MFNGYAVFTPFLSYVWKEVKGKNNFIYTLIYFSV